MNKRTKPIEKPRPKIGDFVARNVLGWCVCRMTGTGWWDFEFFGAACETQEGAEKLAALMTAAHDLAERSHLLKTTSMYKGSDPKLWALSCIVSAVSRAIDGPEQELFHEFLHRRDAERCATCKPASLELETAAA